MAVQDAKERRRAILARAGIREERPVTMPGDAGPVEVVVRELLGTEAQQFEIATAKGSPTAMGFLLQMSIADPETHELLFDPADREALQSQGMSSLRHVLEVIKELNGIDDKDLEKAMQALKAAASNGSS